MAESQHLAQLQVGLARTPWLADCLAVPKGRSLVRNKQFDMNMLIQHWFRFIITSVTQRFYDLCPTCRHHVQLQCVELSLPSCTSLQGGIRWTLGEEIKNGWKGWLMIKSKEVELGKELSLQSCTSLPGGVRLILGEEI